MKKFIYLFAIFFTGLLFSCKTETHSLKGVVLSNNASSGGSKITLVSKEGQKYEAVTDADGRYEIKDLQPGQYLMFTQSAHQSIEPEQQFAQLLNHKDDLLHYLKLNLNEQNYNELKEKMKTSLGVEAMGYYTQLQETANAEVSKISKELSLIWEASNEKKNNVIAVDKVEVQGHTVKELNL